MREGKRNFRDLLAKYDSYWALLIAYVGGILITLTTIWQLTIIPAIVAGMFIKKKARFSWWSGFIGLLLAWLTIILYFINTQPAWELMDMIIEIIIGSPGLAVIGLTLTLGLAGLIGGAGGFLGFCMSTLFPWKKNPSDLSKEEPSQE